MTHYINQRRAARGEKPVNHKRVQRIMQETSYPVMPMNGRRLSIRVIKAPQGGYTKIGLIVAFKPTGQLKNWDGCG